MVKVIQTEGPLNSSVEYSYSLVRRLPKRSGEIEKPLTGFFF